MRLACMRSTSVPVVWEPENLSPTANTDLSTPYRNGALRCPLLTDNRNRSRRHIVRSTRATKRGKSLCYSSLLSTSSLLKTCIGASQMCACISICTCSRIKYSWTQGMTDTPAGRKTYPSNQSIRPSRKKCFQRRIS
ncbi:hypothetical protein RSAG8_02147, partial [Rhizoctonia solani AG-8 WAC10335]